MQRIFSTFLVAGLSVFLIGCGENHGTVPVSIKITQKGTPLAGAIVTAISSDGNSASGTTNDAGVATLQTTQGWAGALPGEYNIAVKKWENYTVPAPSEDDPKATSTEQKNILTAKYGEHSTSGFTLTVGSKAVTETFDLAD